MLKKIIIGSVFASSILVSGIASAVCASNTQTCTGTLSRVLINDAGDLFVAFDGLDVRDTGCTAGSNFMKVESDNIQFKNYYAMLLTAYASGSEMVVRAQTASPTCEVRSMYVNG